MAREVNLGRILRDARSSQGKTLRQMSEAAGLSNAYLCQLETSSSRLLQISWVTLIRVVAAYGLDRKKLEERMHEAALRAKLL